MERVANIRMAHAAQLSDPEQHPIVSFDPKLVDPPLDASFPHVALFSFIPAPPTSVDKPLMACQELTTNPDMLKALMAVETKSGLKGFDGVGKIRGCFRTQKRATAQATQLLTTDPHTRIMTCEIGRPFPVVDPAFVQSADHDELARLVDKTLWYDKAAKMAADEKIAADLKQHAEELCRDVAKPEQTELDLYTETRVKLAHLLREIDAWQNKIAIYQDAVPTCRDKLCAMLQTDPSLEQTFCSIYQEAGRVSNTNISTGFMRYASTGLDMDG